MRVVDLITKKRDGAELTRAEIDYIIQGVTSGEIPDYQIAAWLMAVYFRGMSLRETTDLTLAMAASGEQLDLRDVAPVLADKHSTGGVGDKVTLIVGPLVAACGLPMAKMSGRGLGFSGGTMDKLEAIPRFRTQLTCAEFRQRLRTVGLAVTAQSADLAPADGKLYALRDVTGTVNSIPLIASSVMSKKLAAGAQVIVLDVKMGRGAFMPTLAEATRLAQTMVAIGRRAGRKVNALISDMNQPLGHAVGNALEVREAIETLRNAGPADLREHCLTVAAHLLVLAGKAGSLKTARAQLTAALADGRALAKFKQWIAAQGGAANVAEHFDLLPVADLIKTVPAPRSGYLAEIDARAIGLAAVELGAGRAKKGDVIDLAVGFVLHHKVGDKVARGEPLFSVHANDPKKLALARRQVLAAHTFSGRPVRRLRLFYKVVK